MKKTLIAFLVAAAMAAFTASAAVIEWHAHLTPAYVGSASSGSWTFHATWDGVGPNIVGTWTWTGIVDPSWVWMSQTDAVWNSGQGSVGGPWPGDYTRVANYTAATYVPLSTDHPFDAWVADASQNPIIGGALIQGGPGVPEPHEWGLVAGLGILCFAAVRRRRLLGIAAVAITCCMFAPAALAQDTFGGEIEKRVIETYGEPVDVVKCYVVTYAYRAEEVRPGVFKPVPEVGRVLAVKAKARITADKNGKLVLTIHGGSALDDLADDAIDVTAWLDARGLRPKSLSSVPPTASGKAVTFIPTSGALAMTVAEASMPAE